MNAIEVNKSFYLDEHNNSIQIDVLIPKPVPKPTVVLSHSKEQEISDYLCGQYISELERAITKYSVSEAPNRYIYGQNFIVTNVLPKNTLACYSPENGIIYFDADAINNIRELPVTFLLGHEMGHKIAKYINPNEIYSELCSIFRIPLYRKDMQEETFADIVGYIVSDITAYQYQFSTDSEKDEYVKKRVLNSIYKI